MDAILDLTVLAELDVRDEEEGRAARLIEISNAKDFTLNKLVWRLKLRRLARQGITAKEASRRLGLDYGTVRGIYEDPEFRREVIGEVEGVFADVDAKFAEQQLSMTEKLEKAANVAFDKLYDYMTSDANNLTDAQKAKIAQDFMNRHQESSQVNRNVQLSPKIAAENLMQAAQAAREMDSKIRRIS